MVAMVMAKTMVMERGVDEWGFRTSCWIPGECENYIMRVNSASSYL